MTISFRLDESLSRELKAAARREGVTASEIVRRSVADYLARREGAATAWELGRELFGRFGSGRSDLSTDRKRLVRERLRARADRR